MRLRKALALSAVLVALTAPATAAAPAAFVPAAAAPVPAAVTVDTANGGGGRPAPALPSRARATCGDGKSTEFPIGARIRGGPAVYRTGDSPQSWYLDLVNTTDSRCTAVHPVVVLTDRARALRPAHLRMEFAAPGGPFPASLERTDRDEIIAVFDGGDAFPSASSSASSSGFPGFSVGPGGSLTVKVGLAFAADAPHGEVVADAALVQRKGADGDWVGESGGYRFSVKGPADPAGAGVRAGAGALARTGPREVAYGAGSVAALALGAGLLLGARRLRAGPR